MDEFHFAAARDLRVGGGVHVCTSLDNHYHATIVKPVQFIPSSLNRDTKFEDTAFLLTLNCFIEVF